MAADSHGLKFELIRRLSGYRIFCFPLVGVAWCKRQKLTLIDNYKHIRVAQNQHSSIRNAEEAGTSASEHLFVLEIENHF
jgi:hypothetical protein